MELEFMDDSSLNNEKQPNKSVIQIAGDHYSDLDDINVKELKTPQKVMKLNKTSRNIDVGTHRRGDS